MKKKRIRNIPIHVMLSEKEAEAIKIRMEDSGIINKSAFVRRMAIKGYALNVDTSPLNEMITLQRRCVNNLKQIAEHTKENNIYVYEITDLQKKYDNLWDSVSKILNCFSKIIGS